MAGRDMTRLILTSGSGYGLGCTDLADVVIPFSFRFVWGPLPSPDELAAYLAVRSDNHVRGTHWSDYVGRWRPATKARKNLGLLEFCWHCETIELWFDANPNDQSHLVWLLDYFSSHPEIVARLRLRLVDYDLITASAEELGRWKVPAVDVTKKELETANATWQAYRATTPKACLRSSQQGFKHFAAVEAGLVRPAGRAPIPRDGAWRDGNADPRVDLGRLLAIRPPPFIHRALSAPRIQRKGVRYAA
jgi:hypothetical protein